jgi:hypothetical protein
VRAALNDLYRYELRVLRARLLRGEFPRASYYARVVEIRKRYRIMSVPLAEWTESA